jgi:hypothetical protein
MDRILHYGKIFDVAKDPVLLRTTLLSAMRNDARDLKNVLRRGISAATQCRRRLLTTTPSRSA